MAVGEQDAFAEQLCFEGSSCSGFGSEPQSHVGGCVAGEGGGDDPVDPAWRDDAGDLGFDSVAGFAGAPAGEAGCQLGEESVGFGQGLQKLGYLPLAYSDFVFSTIGEEWGFLGVTLTVLLYATFILVGFRIARFAPDRFGVNPCQPLPDIRSILREDDFTFVHFVLPCAS